MREDDGGCEKRMGKVLYGVLCWEILSGRMVRDNKWFVWGALSVQKKMLGFYNLGNSSSTSSAVGRRV